MGDKSFSGLKPTEPEIEKPLIKLHFWFHIFDELDVLSEVKGAVCLAQPSMFPYGALLTYRSLQLIWQQTLARCLHNLIAEMVKGEFRLPIQDLLLLPLRGNSEPLST